MNRFNVILISLLSIQIVLTASLYFSGQVVSGQAQQQALLEAPIDSIDRISIDDTDGNQSVMTKIDGKWILPEYHQLPANQERVNNLLSLLQKTITGWPVATTESSRKRFKLSEDEFNKKVVISQGTKHEQTLYLGTSPGFRQLHVRRSGDEEIYALKLNSHDFPAKSSDLIDNTLLQLTGNIDKIEGMDFSFIRQEDSWIPAKLEGKANKDELKKLNNTLARLIILGAEKKPKEIKDDYRLSVSTGQKNHDYRLFKQGDQHLVHRNDHELAFIITQSDYDKITTQNSATLVMQDKSEDDKMMSEEDRPESSAGDTETSSKQQAGGDQDSS